MQWSLGWFCPKSRSLVLSPASCNHADWTRTAVAQLGFFCPGIQRPALARYQYDTKLASELFEVFQRVAARLGVTGDSTLSFFLRLQSRSDGRNDGKAYQ